ncbi:MAG: carboxypeptidase-like regulatory domain-containing protein [Paludibacter sp.]|nr:carboxypeptidase-like regulatory domain-containing protein [Paludibacter sp.]
MKKVLFISLVVMLAFVSNVSAKETANAEAKAAVINTTSQVIKGIVSDKLTNESLAGAKITLNGQKIYSDLDGNFELPKTDLQKFQLKISMISYEDLLVNVDLQKTKKLEIKLSQR